LLLGRIVHFVPFDSSVKEHARTDAGSIACEASAATRREGFG